MRTSKCYSPALLVMIASVSTGCCDEHKVESSAPSACSGINEVELQRMKRDASLPHPTNNEMKLSNARKLRDYYVLCDLKEVNVREALYWAQIAAEIGNATDANNLEVIQNVYSQ